MARLVAVTIYEARSCPFSLKRETLYCTWQRRFTQKSAISFTVLFQRFIYPDSCKLNASQHARRTFCPWIIKSLYKVYINNYSQPHVLSPTNRISIQQHVRCIYADPYSQYLSSLFSPTAKPIRIEIRINYAIFNQPINASREPLRNNENPYTHISRAKVRVHEHYATITYTSHHPNNSPARCSFYCSHFFHTANTHGRAWRYYKSPCVPAALLVLTSALKPPDYHLSAPTCPIFPLTLP